jgi:hypothetical protein
MLPLPPAILSTTNFRHCPLLRPREKLWDAVDPAHARVPVRKRLRAAFQSCSGSGPMDISGLKWHCTARGDKPPGQRRSPVPEDLGQTKTKT